MTKAIIFSISILLGLFANAQELNCVVKVNFKQIQGTETRVFENMEKSIYEFMNNTKWTKDVIKLEERIECSVFITLRTKNNNQYEATIQISSRRPVYNSSYYSTMFNHLDENFVFTYSEFAPLDFNKNAHITNLTSVLAFYAYIIIGLDYDSFGLKGGSEYYDQAQKISNNAQSERSEGWKPYESDKNRYWLANALNDNFFAPLRDCLYNYHMQGLDLMQQNADQGRKNITKALDGLNKIHQTRPSSFILRVFFNAKSDEIVNIYSEATPSEKNQITSICILLDPGNAQKYDKILTGK